MRLSVQLYTVREPLAADPIGTLRKLRAIGLEYVEGGGSFGGETPEESRKILDDLGLKVSGAHTPLDALQGDLDAVIASHEALGNKYVIVPYLAEADRDYARLAEILTPIGAKLKDAGLTLCYHNHDFEFVEQNGMPGLDLLFSETEPSLLKAELDLAWVKIGGADPVAYIEKYTGRLPLVHLKDFDPTQTPRWQPAGQGVMDWDACLAAANKAGVEFGAIELDESPGDPLDAVKASFEFFAEKGLS